MPSAKVKLKKKKEDEYDFEPDNEPFYIIPKSKNRSKVRKNRR